MGQERKSILADFGLETQEKAALIKHKHKQGYIGLPRETSFQEHRIALTPDAVRTLVANGHRVVIESRAGEGANFSDMQFSEAGAEVVNDRKTVYEADIIIKVAPPTENEVELLKMHQVLISPIHLPTLKYHYIEKLMEKKVTALAFEYIKDSSGTFPFVRSMSEIAGSTVIIIAANHLSDPQDGTGILLGGASGVLPAKVVILGAGVVGEFATRTALGLGANVKIFDDNIYKLMRLQNNIGQRLATSAIHPDILAEELKSADVAVGAIHSESGRAPIVVTEEMVQDMKQGSMILDVSIDQGGCFETSEVTNHDDPIFEKFGVFHYCVPNIPSRVARTGSHAISNILTSKLIKAAEMGGFEKMLYYELSDRHGVYIYRGCLTNHNLGQMFNIKSTDLDLLFTSKM